MQLDTALLLYYAMIIIFCDLTVTLSAYSPLSGQANLQKLDDIKNGIGIKGQKVCKQFWDQRSMKANKKLKCYQRMKINPKVLSILILTALG